MNRIRRRTAVLGAVALGALGVGAVVASPAQAVTPCNNRLCYDENAGYEGASGQHSSADIVNLGPYFDGWQWRPAGYLNDKISSIRNHDSVSWCFWENVNATGNKYQVYPGWDVPQVPAYINDKISYATRGNCW
ncbi:peptidase inhibitor family I36 protein [Actinoplanes sp. NPDC048796]|uniref:peptidase inhibitor family I36 protein n=1 Tax=unclassified Actinoplanes TaxID=2626549 RepID=UPI0033CBF0ED